MTAAVGGVLSGANPFIYDASSPITLFLIQACLILLMCNLIHLFFARIRQPKVISEVIAGVILGPTVLGQIPNYTNTIFPAESINGLNLTANLGIILFMFFLGLEVDTEFIKRHIKTALSLGLASLAVPFGCGCLLAIPLYNTYGNQGSSTFHVKFTVFMVFIAVSISVTAFPVLCRILNELRLIRDRAGIVVLAAGIVNDILGWILLALSVILSNSESSPVNTVYILLCTFGWFLLYFYPVKYILRWTLIRSHELDRTNPSPVATMCILFLMFISAYFTDIIGVHPIFGAFIAGLIVPRENNYVIKLVERMEDIPNIVLIPIYFAVAGLNVDLTLLNEGKDWGYVFASIGIAITSKVSAGTVVSLLHGLFLRESLAVGILMSCKGIVEIVVLTVGLNAGIISKKIFAMFILMALVSTFITTPLTQMVYTDEYRKKINQILKEGKSSDEEATESEVHIIKEPIDVLTLEKFESIKEFYPTRLINIVNAKETVSTNLELLNLLIGGKSATIKSSRFLMSETVSRKSSVSTLKSKSNKIRRLLSHKDDADPGMTTIREIPSSFNSPIALKAVRLKMLTERTTDLLQSSNFYHDEPDFAANTDTVLQIFDIFSRFSKIPFSSQVIFSTIKEKAQHISSMDTKESDLILLPLRGTSYEGPDNHLIVQNYQDFNQILLHLLSINQLSTNFFQLLASSLNNHFVLQLSSTGGRLAADRFKTRSFNLILPNPYLTSSDYLAIYLLISICHREIGEGNSIHATVFINSKNANFSENLYDLFSTEDWFDESLLHIVEVDTKSRINSELHSFFDMILSCGQLNVYDLEDSTFIIPEVSFSKHDPFSADVKSTILQGSWKKFNILIAHYHFQDSKFIKSESII